MTSARSTSTAPPAYDRELGQRRARRRSCTAPDDLRKVSLRLGYAAMQTTMMYLCADPIEKVATVTVFGPMPGRQVRLRPPDKLIASLHRR